MPDWFFIFTIIKYFLNPQDQINGCMVGNKVINCIYTESIARSFHNDMPFNKHVLNLHHIIISFCVMCFLLHCVFFKYFVNKTCSVDTTCINKVGIFTHQSFKNTLLQNLLILLLPMTFMMLHLYTYTNTMVVVDYTTNIYGITSVFTKKNNLFESFTTTNHNNFLLDYNDLFFNIFYWQSPIGWFYTSENINLSFLHDIY